MKKYILCGLILTLASTLSFAQQMREDDHVSVNQGTEWEKLPDGKVKIDLLGVQLAFPKDSSNHVSIFSEIKNLSDRIPSSPRSGGLKISDIIKHPSETKAALDEAVKAGKVQIRITASDIPVSVGNRKALLKGYRADIDLYYPPITEWESVPSKCQPSISKSSLISDTDRAGFELVYESRSPHYETYCLEAKNNLADPRRALTISCNELGQTCSAYFVSGSKRATIGYRFPAHFVVPQKGAPQERDYFSMREWNELNQKIHAYFSAILISEEIF